MNFFKDKEFAELRMVLDSEMKRLKKAGIHPRGLRRKNCQIQVVEQPSEHSYLHYVEDLSKNNPGGLKGRKNQSKDVIQHSNEASPARCPVLLFKLYDKLCPANVQKMLFTCSLW